MRGLYKIHIEYGRDSAIDSLFIADCDKMNYLLNHGIGIRFGYDIEVDTLDDFGFELVTTDENIIKMVEENDLETGPNPLESILYLSDDYEWENTDVSDEFIEKWDSDDYTVKEFIDYCMTGKLPEGFND